ncbi:sugar transferase [Candidatus Cryosericum septentrionale]|nr:sugar transferase [Candidatus Cryosericum septentrionale]
MSKKMLDTLVGFAQAVTNLLVLVGTYWAVFAIRAALGHPYGTANRLAVEAVFPYLAAFYVVLWLVYRLPAYYETATYEGVLSQVFVQLILALASLATSFVVRAFAFPRGLVATAFVLQVTALVPLNYALCRFYSRVRPKALTIAIGTGAAAGSTLAKQLSISTAYVVSSMSARDVTGEWIHGVPEGASLTLDASVPSPERDRILRLAMRNGITVQLVATVKETLVQKAPMKVRADHLMLTVEPYGHSPVDLALKRMLDIAASVVALTVFSPVFLLASIAIMLEDGRPVFYLQQRLGFRGQFFRIIKFRTMCHDAERLTGARLSKGELDSRITRAGRLLRRTGLDEVPQFIDVLRGDMSVVGPRPERPELAQKILEETPDWNLRLLVRPGITGVAQVLGRYNTAPEDKLTMDLAYIRSRSLFNYDLTIILNTLKMFFMPERRD